MDNNSHFDLEERHDKEILPLIRELCDKAQDVGLPIFVITCYHSNDEGVHLASSARGRRGFVPQEFHIIRAVIEGSVQCVEIEELASRMADHIAGQVSGSGKN